MLRAARQRTRLTVTALVVALALVATACLLSDSTRSGGDSALRDPLLWPYPAESIWNHPRGDDARLVAFPLASDDLTVGAEEDVLFLTPEAPERDVYATTAGWDRDQSRCGSATGEVLAEDLPIPEGWTTEPDYTGATPNQAAAIVMPDATLVEVQPLHVCTDGTVVAQHAPTGWRGSSILTGGTADDLGGGSHGGSGLTAFGGTVRLGEWVPGGRIPHALKLTVDGSALSSTDGGFRWPADRADDYYASGYQGSVPQARMGALLTLSPDFDLGDLETEAATILARALQQYGAYVVDDAGQASVGVAVEWGPQGRVKDEFEQVWGHPLTGRAAYATGEQGDFLDDLELVWSQVQVVDDNDPDSIGGAGDPLAPFAPPLAVS